MLPIAKNIWKLFVATAVSLLFCDLATSLLLKSERKFERNPYGLNSLGVRFVSPHCSSHFSQFSRSSLCFDHSSFQFCTNHIFASVLRIRRPFVSNRSRHIKPIHVTNVTLWERCATRREHDRLGRFKRRNWQRHEEWERRGSQENQRNVRVSWRKARASDRSVR